MAGSCALKGYGVMGCAVLVSLMAYSLAQSTYCTAVHNSTGPLAFVDPYPEQPVIQVAVTSFFLSCCSGNRPNISTSWYKWRPDRKWWCPQNQTEEECINWSYRHTSDNGQTLVFENAGVEDDKGQYLCVATDGQTSINRTFDVLVVDCIPNPDKINFFKPSKPQASVGSTFTEKCEGNFGCYGAVANDSLAWWSYIDGAGHHHELSVGTHGRYVIKETISEDETKKGSVMTVSSMTDEDFANTFICSLKMRNLHVEGFRFSVMKTENKMTWMMLIHLFMGIFLVLLVAIIVAGLTYSLCRPVVLFKYKSLTKQLPKRDGRLFDVRLIGRQEEDEEEEVRKLMTAMLTEKGWRLQPPQLTGTPIGEINSLEACVSIIFVIHPPSLRTLGQYLDTFDQCFSAGTLVKANIIFVLTQSMSKADWKLLSRDYKVYFHTAKLCTVAVWPGSHGSKRQRTNFWCQVQSFLPDPRVCGDDEETNTPTQTVISDSLSTERTPLADDCVYS